MNFSTNDPAGVKSLLDQLRSSQALSALTSNNEAKPPQPPSNFEPTAPNTQPSVSEHISSLLAKLQSAPNGSASSPSLPQQPQLYTSPPKPSTSRYHDMRSLTFHQALSPLAQILDDPEKCKALRKIYENQSKVEEGLWAARQEIVRKHEEKFNIMKTTARITGLDPTPRHVAALSSELQSSLHKFEKERVLAGWDAQISRQQAAMEALGVPTMFVTNDPVDRERQQRVIQVISDALDIRR